MHFPSTVVTVESVDIFSSASWVGATDVRLGLGTWYCFFNRYFSLGRLTINVYCTQFLAGTCKLDKYYKDILIR